MSYPVTPGKRPSALDMLKGMSASQTPATPPVAAPEDQEESVPSDSPREAFNALRAPTRPRPRALDLLRTPSPAPKADADAPDAEARPVETPSLGLRATPERPSALDLLKQSEPPRGPGSLSGMSPDLAAVFGDSPDNVPTTQGVATATRALGDEDIVAAGDKALRQRFAEFVTTDFDPFTPEGVVRAPEPEEPQAAGEEIETLLYTPGIDVASMRSKLARYKMRRAFDLAEARSEDGKIDNATRRDIVARAYNEAHAEVRRMVDHQENVAFVFTDTDPQGTDMDIVTGFGGRSLSPVRAWLKPYTHVSYAPKTLAQTGPEGEVRETQVRETGQLYDRQGLWGYLQWAFQGATGLAATAVAAGDQIQAETLQETGVDVGTSIPFLQVIDDALRGYGTLEHVQAIRRGSDVFSYTREIARSPEAAVWTAGGTALGQSVAPHLFEAAGIVEDQEQGKALIETIQGAGIGLALSVVEPDAIFGTTFAVGRAAKAAGRAVDLRAASRMESTAQTLDRAVQGLEAAEQAAKSADPGLITPEQALSEARAARMAPAAREDVEMRASAAMDEALRDLPPEVRSSVESDMLLRTAWDPALTAMTEASMRKARNADARFQAEQTRAVSATQDAAERVAEGLRAASRGEVKAERLPDPPPTPDATAAVKAAEETLASKEAALTKARKGLDAATKKTTTETVKRRSKDARAKEAGKGAVEAARGPALAKAEAKVKKTEDDLKRFERRKKQLESLIKRGQNVEENKRFLKNKKAEIKRAEARLESRQAELKELTDEAAEEYNAARAAADKAAKKASPEAVSQEFLEAGRKRVESVKKAEEALSKARRALADAQAKERAAQEAARRAQQAEADERSVRGIRFEDVDPEHPEGRQMRQALAEAELALREQEHTAHTLVLAELEAQLDAVKGLGAFRGSDQVKEADQVLADTARSALQDALLSRVRYYQSTDEGKAAAALRENAKAMQRFREAAAAAVRLNGSRALGDLQGLLKSQKTRVADASDALADTVRRVQKAQALDEADPRHIGLIRRDNVQASDAQALEIAHRRRLSKLVKTQYFKDLARGSTILTTMRESLRAHASSYKALAKGLRTPLKRAPMDADSEIRHITRLLPEPVDGVVRLTALPRDLAAALMRPGMEGATSVDGPGLAQHIIGRLRASSGMSDKGVALMRENSPLFARLERMADGITDDVVIGPDELRQMMDSAINISDVERLGEVSIAAAGELRRPHIEYMTAAFAGSPWRQVVHKGFLQAQRLMKVLAKPHIDAFGPGRDDMLQVAKGATDAQRYGMFELAKAYDEGVAWARRTNSRRSDGIKLSAINICDSVPGDVVDGPQVSSVLVGSHTGTLWSQARVFMMQMAAADEMNASMDALMRAWLPAGYDTQRFLARITAEAREVWAKTQDVEKVLDVLGPNVRALATQEDLEYLRRGLKVVELVTQKEPITFAEFMEKMRQHTVRVQGAGLSTRAVAADVARETARAYGIASQAVMHGAILHRMTQQIAGKLVGFDARALTAAMHVTEGLTPQEAGSLYAEASAAMVRMGVPPRLRKLVNDTGEDIQAGLIMLNKAETADAALLPRQWLRAMDDQLGRIIKETTDYAVAATNPMQGMMRSTVSRLAKLFRMSITSGLIWHSPRYLTSMMAGNMAQIFADPLGGARAAAGSAAQVAGRAVSAGTYAAVHGTFSPLRMAASKSQTVQRFRQGLDRLHDVMVGKYGEDRALPSSVAALYNPHVSNFFDPQRVKADATIRTAAGDVVTMGYLREEALKHGVLTTYASTDLMDVLSRTADMASRREVYEPGGFAKAAAEGAETGGLRGAAAAAGVRARDVVRAANPLAGKGRGPLHYMERRGAAIADFADSVEQRQRVALFLDHVVNKGYSPDKAGALVREALYDWGHGVTKFEAEHLNDWFLFWRFLRLSQRQGVRILGNGFVRGYRADDWSEALNTNLSTSTGRMALLVRGEEAKREVAGYRNRLMYEDDEYRARFNDRYPWWAASRATPFILNQPLSEEMVALQRDLGKDATHMAYSQSNLTPFDTVGMQLAALATMARIATAEETTDLTDISTGFSVVLEAMAEKAGPVGGEMLQGLNAAFFGAEQRTSVLPTKLRPTEHALLSAKDSVARTVGLDGYFAPSVVRMKGKDAPGVTRADRSLVVAMRLMPVLGTEIPYWLDPVITVRAGYGEAARPDAGAASQLAAEGLFLVRQYTGMLKEYAHAPEDSRDYNMTSAEARTQSKITRLNNRQYLIDTSYRDMRGRLKDGDED